MLRVHGEKIVKRRLSIKEYKDFHRYRPYLKEDFLGICGYCGKDSSIIKEQFEIDHFVPQDIDGSRECDYKNLVFSCKKCNRAKWNKWPTNDPNKSNDGKEGFVDPASEEYDTHMKRDKDGNIYGDTDVGIYMCKELNFDIRPISSVWRAMELSYKEELLAQKIKEEKSLDNLSEYYEVNELLKQILKFLFDGGN